MTDPQTTIQRHNWRKILFWIFALAMFARVEYLQFTDQGNLAEIEKAVVKMVSCQ